MSQPDRSPAPAELHHDDIVYPGTLPFVLFHASALAAFWTGVPVWALALCVALYFIRMIAVTAGYHRYFSHRSFKTSRVGQFLLAFLAQSSAQRGAIWWAAKHRAHHKHSDTELDPHSPHHRGFWFSHVGWIFAPKSTEADLALVPDLTRYPELVWLDRHQYVAPTVLGIVVWLLAGWPGLIVGFVWSTVLLWHGSFAINSLAHLSGRQRYVTGDHSRNSLLLALITCGEGWHNNHHHFQSATRQGFRWWEVDLTYYVLRALALVGVVWDLKEPPAEVVSGERRLATVAVDRAAKRLAESFPLDQIAAHVREAWDRTLDREEWNALARQARSRLDAFLTQVQMPQLPTVDQLRSRAAQMLPDTSSLEAIVQRARRYVAEAVVERLEAI